MTDTDNTQRNAEMYRLRLKGYSPEDIAGLYGLSPDTVAEIVGRVISQLRRHDPQASKLLELDRLDRLLLKAVQVLNRKHLTVSHGRIVRDENGKPVLDDGPTLAAIQTVLRIMERRARYEGTDAPTTHILETPPTPLSLELQELVNEAKARTANITPADIGLVDSDLDDED